MQPETSGIKTELVFSIDYHTTPGEQLVLNVIGGDKGLPAASHPMTTDDGRMWTCCLSNDGVATHIDYYYTVERDGRELRHEWLVSPHRLELVAAGATCYTVCDRWTDRPADAWLYTSAFTDCVAARKRRMSDGTAYAKTVRLKVRATGLAAGERLALVGDAAILGGWDTGKALPMTEHAPNEWVLTLDGTLLEGRTAEYKFVIVAAEDEAEVTADNKVEWETGENRVLTVGAMEPGHATVIELSQPVFCRRPWRGAGTVIPVFSLRSEGSFGVGDFGDLRMFVDWACRTGQCAIQILPINDTCIAHTWQDSYPYNSISIYALHPQYVDLRQLPPLNDESRRRHYETLRRELNALPQIDYERMSEAKMAYLRELYEQEGETVCAGSAFAAFFERNSRWLVPYAAFCHYRDLYGTATFGLWPAHRTFTDAERAAMSDPQTEIYREVAFWYFVQYHLDRQMRDVHAYARRHRVILKGDIPIGISRDGVEAWVEPRYFNLDGQAGAPPDAFSVNGQNWGFPTYNWEAMMADGCSWWERRFRKMAEYFDAYRIDHVLGFFRIWEIPLSSIHGLLGQFSPALGMTPGEIESYGLRWQEQLFTRPFITDAVLEDLFGSAADAVRNRFLCPIDNTFYAFRPEYDTQRKLRDCFAREAESNTVFTSDDLERLYSLQSNVLFLRDHRKPGLFHPRINVHGESVYLQLSDADREAFSRLHDDYFYRRNNRFWYSEAMEKLPRLAEATRMLVCAEDLGMVPECVPWVMDELRILTLEIQSMPKEMYVRFGTLSRNPYRSVSTISTHDMPTLRQWWDEDAGRAQDYYTTSLCRTGKAPHPLPGCLAADIVKAHLDSPSMLCLLSLQDWLAVDKRLRLPDADAERINIPANPRHYWRYRMHLTIEQLMQADAFNAAIGSMIAGSGRD